jgi:dsRNA-specific ribonuclease
MELGKGRGYSKKESQQNACKNALHRLKKGNKVYETLIQNKAINPE